MSHQFPSPTYLTPTQRRILLVTHLVVMGGYLVINRVMSHLGGGTTFDIGLDRYVPFRPIWVVPYVLALVWWGAAVLWAFLEMEDGLYVAFTTGWIGACLIGYSIFILYPNYMIRPEVTGDGWAEVFIRFIYANDRVYNAFPSQHLWDTVIITLFFGRWKPALRWPLWGFTFIVALSTLFTGQHWILDVLGGTLLGMIGYYIGLAVAARLKTIPRRRASQVSR